MIKRHDDTTKTFKESIKLYWWMLIALLAVSLTACGGGGGTSAAPAPASNVTVSGFITFDSVPALPISGLVYLYTTQKPVRGVVLQALNASDSSVLATTNTDSSGYYSVTVPTNTNVKIRVKAQMLKSGPPSWDFQVVDNTNSKALYVMDSSSFNSGTLNITGKTLNASSGWGGFSYTSTRVAAPFAILDTVYKAVQKITAADTTASMPQLLINWSINNITTSGDKTLGQIGTSHYAISEKQLYILGKADNDTDEYDDHIIAHEWGHYFESNFSRSDSVGGSHGPGNELDPRLAFGEGFGNAFSGMATDDPYYIDTSDVSQASVSIFANLSNSNGDPSSIGWYSEDSVQYILYSLYLNLGFSPIYNVLVNQQKNASSFTTVYSFISFLKTNNPPAITTINNLLTTKNITTTAVDEWDSTGTETNNGGNAKALPVYTKLIVGSPAVQLCGNDQFGVKNKLMNRRFIYFNIASSGTYNISVSPVTAGGIPNIIIKSKSQEIGSTNNTVSIPVTLTGILTPGSYVGEVYDDRYLTESTPASGEVCFNLTLS